ncbi:unnamed protein product [Enterobius vermicularis]|uniref:LINES_N domain-containing protein n=1 Tax=Enterobius vermicularis TaxID=51028 RepID=A0A0N4UVB9_ENTVE|nr:unnamed protein product [Enterobius vermicularis]
MMEVTATEKAALSLLLKWKDRLRDGNEEQLKNCFENFSEILSENFLTVEDSAPRRSLLFIIEKLTLLCWQDCQYGKKPVLDLYIPFINTAYNEMSKIVSRIQFSRFESWFGGIDRNAESKYPLSSTSFLSICIHLIGLSVHLREVKSIRNFILDLAVMVETNRELSVRLIEHDESELPPHFCPQLLFLNILQQIDFDYSVALDWLNSEPVAIAFILRFMKDLQANPNLYDLSVLPAEPSFLFVAGYPNFNDWCTVSARVVGHLMIPYLATVLSLITGSWQGASWSRVDSAVDVTPNFQSPALRSTKSRRTCSQLNSVDGLTEVRAEKNFNINLVRVGMCGRGTKGFKRKPSYEPRESVKVKIYQVHGNELVQSNFNFPRNEPPVFFDEMGMSYTGRSYASEDLIGFIYRLRSACGRLQKANIAPFNMVRLIQEMEKAEKAIENSNDT